MCYSANASFWSAVILAVLGTVSLHQTKLWSLRMFAAIPLLFAFQQLAEGIVWLTIDHPTNFAHTPAIYMFLFFALIVWPTWLPISLLLAEKKTRARICLALLACAGLAVSGYAIMMLGQSTPSVHIGARSLCYDFASPANSWLQALCLVGYCIPTLVPFFVATLAYAPFLGIAAIIALGATLAFKFVAFTSVWCFFAAILSVLVIISVMIQQHRIKNEQDKS